LDHAQSGTPLSTLTCPPRTTIVFSVMKKTTTYTIQELLSKHPHNQDLQKIDWTKKKDDVEFALSSILGGDWSVNKKNKTVTNLH
jgi:hypothetical protein